MNRENLASIITRMQLCNGSRLENKDDYLKIKSYLLSLDDIQFFQKLWEFGFYDKEAS
tara:strand:+ start:146 stop:319 length:174 start_codon:yes stop_codon:yes gene_type:complete